MKKGLIIVSILLIGATVAQAVSNGVLDYFSGRMEGDAISLEWKSSIETGLKHYVVERTTNKTQDYKEVGTIKALGSFATYRHKDVRPAFNVQAGEMQEFQPEPMADLYKYRLKLIYDKEISYSQTISVSKPSSGVKRTWGMIKEMFH